MTAPPADAPATLTVPRLLTIDETAQILACSKRTVWRLISEGELPFVQRGKRRVRADDLRDYIDGLERVGHSGSRRRRRPQPSARPYDFLKD